jgi:hypothetical protein
LLLKLDDTGAFIWIKMWGDTAIDEYVMGAQPTYDGNYILLAAHDYDVAPLWGQSALIKMDTGGNILWAYEYGGNNYYHVPYQMVQTRDTGFLIVGYRSDPFGGNRDLMLIKADSTGNHEWTKYYGAVLDGWGGAITESLEGGYLVAGYREIVEDIEFKGWLLKVDENGGLQWERFYSHDPWIDNGFWQRLIQLRDGSYVTLGSTELNTGLDLGLITMVDCHGNKLWSRAYTRDSTRPHYFYGLDTTSDGGFIVCGSTQLTGQSQDGWLLKLDEYGCDTPGCQVNDTAVAVPCFTSVPQLPMREFGITVWPNPNNGMFTVELPGYGQWHMELFDLHGRVIEERLVPTPLGLAGWPGQTGVEGMRRQLWDVTRVPGGLHLLRATREDGLSITVKLVVE